LWDAVKAMLEPAMSRGSNALLVLGESCKQHALHGPHFPPLESQPTCGHGNRTPRQSHTMAVSLFSPRRSSRTQLPALEIWTLHRKLLLAVARSLTHPLSIALFTCVYLAPQPRHSHGCWSGGAVCALETERNERNPARVGRVQGRGCGAGVASPQNRNCAHHNHCRYNVSEQAVCG
jgi:hypothetical protein